MRFCINILVCWNNDIVSIAEKKKKIQTWNLMKKTIFVKWVFNSNCIPMCVDCRAFRNVHTSESDWAFLHNLLLFVSMHVRFKKIIEKFTFSA